MIAFSKGFFDCFSGFSLLFKPGIKRFVLIPLIINLGLFSLATKLLSEQLDIWLEKLLPDWLDWLEWLILPLFAITLFFIVFYTFTIIANLIAAPFNSLLSAKIEAMLTGRKPGDINSDNFIKLIFRTTKSEIQKILYAIKWFIPLIIITIIPGVNIVAPFLWILFTAWFFALEYNDYPLANRGLFFEDVTSYNRENRMRSLGLGSAVFILTSIPIINFFAMPVAVAGATKLTVKLTEKTNKEFEVI
ncbi:Sulfate transporter, CysZ-type [hydrothermal vent metagenome]|uniref:Sulfate transporter, CysZ-type n=1 Tax=hydrothermal vent metagenome TaxID=652676 RepID=A0A3B0WLQ9_9ZZZZ